MTGAAGFAGSHLLDLLFRDREEIVAWRRPGVRSGLGTDDKSVIWEEVDVLDRAAVRAAIIRFQPDAVYHCAGAAHVGRAWDRVENTLAINVRGTHHVLDALTRVSRPARMLIPSSALVYAPSDTAIDENHPIAPSSPYGLSKLAQEMLARHPHGPVTVLVARSFNHFGPRQNPWFVASGFARRIADIEKGRWAPEIAVGNLETMRDLTDVRDTVAAYRLILRDGSPGDVFNVCSGKAISIRSLLEALIARARVPVVIKADPARYRPNDTPVLLGDPHRIQQRLGWQPEIPLDRTIDDLLQYWRDQP